MSTAGEDRRIDYMEFPALDIAATKQFYSDVFGWRFEDYGPGIPAFTTVV
jgi:predicted enzyme related to lactoylglutathione lyase